MITLPTVLIILLILILIGVMPVHRHSAAWGYGPTGIVGVLLVVLLILVILGRFPT